MRKTGEIVRAEVRKLARNYARRHVPVPAAGRLAPVDVAGRSRGTLGEASAHRAVWPAGVVGQPPSRWPARRCAAGPRPA
jgi:hypothetical protein